MPRVISYTPSWLSRPSAGFAFFCSDSAADGLNGFPKTEPSHASNATGPAQLPTKVVAHRGTEVFFAVGSEIRWADLVSLKEQSSKGDETSQHKHYKVLKTPVRSQIRQLAVSPRGEFLAILTSHTVHVALIPDSSHLSPVNDVHVKLKVWQLGPTVHVLDQEPVVSALWHPLGVGRRCLVTISRDAVVRLWELSRDDRWSFDNAALAVDLKRLDDSTTVEDLLESGKRTRVKGFSPDSFDMQVASACFGGKGESTEYPWAATTLWIAMAGGDVYALCPLLPSRWQPSETMILSIMALVSGRRGFAPAQGSKFPQQSEQQYQWIRDLNEQDTTVGQDDADATAPRIYRRPTSTAAIPKLQGPYHVEPEIELDLDEELTDILAFPGKGNYRTFIEEVQLDNRQEGLSQTIICLGTSSGRVLVCTESECIEGHWLPFTMASPVPQIKSSLLLGIESVEVRLNSCHGIDRPMFTPDVLSPYSFFVTCASGVMYVSFDEWTKKIEEELNGYDESGSTFRLDILFQGSGASVQRVLEFPLEDDFSKEQLSPSIVFNNVDLGYYLLGAVPNNPFAASLDTGSKRSESSDDHIPRDTLFDDPVPLLQQWPPYQPAAPLYQRSELKRLMNSYTQGHYRRMLNDEIRLSPATLNILTEVHRLLSRETHQLGLAVADLFRRCEALQEILRDQITKAAEISTRIENVVGDDDSLEGRNGLSTSGREAIAERLLNVEERQTELKRRYERIRVRLQEVGGHQLAQKEEAWIREVDRIASSMEETAVDSARPQNQESAVERYHTVKSMKEQFGSEADEISQLRRGDSGHGSIKAPPDLRKGKLAGIQELLSRESALVEAIQQRIDLLCYDA